MEWEDAKRRIGRKVKDGDNLNTARSSYRFVKAVNHLGYRVPIGQKTHINIPWGMLEKCWRELDRIGWYDRGVFGRLFPNELETHDCYVHTVGMIFEKAGLARSDGGGAYLLLK